MEGALWLVVLLAVVGATALLCRRLGLSKGQTITCAALALVGTLAATGGLWWASFAECFGENREPPRPLSWPWSPRREFCSQSGSPAALGALALLAVPPLIVWLGALLWSKRRGAIAAGAFVLPDCGDAFPPKPLRGPVALLPVG